MKIKSHISAKEWWAILAVSVLILSAPFWHAAFEKPVLKITSVSPTTVHSGEFMLVQGSGFRKDSKFWYGQVEFKKVWYVDNHTVFVQVP